MIAFFRNAWDILARLLGAIGALMTGGSLSLLGLMMGADYLAGIVLSVLGKSKQTINGRLSCKECVMELAQKAMMLLIVLVAAAIDEMAGQEKLLRSAAVGFYICNEGIGLLEKAALLGVPVPQKLKRALGALRETEKEEKADGNIWRELAVGNGKKA